LFASIDAADGAVFVTATSELTVGFGVPTLRRCASADTVRSRARYRLHLDVNDDVLTGTWSNVHLSCCPPLELDTAGSATAVPPSDDDPGT